MAHVTITKFRSDENLGMYGFATDSYCLVGNTLDESEITKLKDTLQVPVYQLSLCGTSLIGIFATGDDKTLIIPANVFDHELVKIKEIVGELGIRLVIVDTTYTALGNIMTYRDGVIFTNHDVEESIFDQIQESLSDMYEEITVHRVDVADTDVVGSAVVINANGGLIHPETDEAVISLMEKEFGFELTLGTVNYGSNYVRSGIIANKNGFVIGASSSGPEITNADEAFGFVNQK